MATMRITFLGHVGFFVETRGGSVLCDPVVHAGVLRLVVPVPAQRRARSRRRSRRPTTSTSRTSIATTSIREWLARHVDKRARVLLPDVRRAVPASVSCARSASRTSCARRHGEPVDLDGLARDDPRVHHSRPTARSATRSSCIDDGTRARAQPERRPARRSRRACARSVRSTRRSCSSPGAIWYPIAYDFPPELKTRLAREKRVNQMARARQYVEWVDAAHVFPCAGPPSFLDDDLFALNDLDRDPANIFPDQTVFLDLLARRGHRPGRAARARVGDRARRRASAR